MRNRLGKNDDLETAKIKLMARIESKNKTTHHSPKKQIALDLTGLFIAIMTETVLQSNAA